MNNKTTTNYGNVIHYHTNAFVRYATLADLTKSVEAARNGRGDASGVFEDDDGERVYCDGDTRLVPYATEEDAVAAVGTDPHAYVVEGVDGRFYIEPNAEKAAARLLKGRARYGLEEQTIALDLAYSEGADLSAVPVLYQRDV